MVSVLIIGDTIYCAILGDSRSVLGSKRSSWIAVELSHDHKPNNETEAQWILEYGGRILGLNKESSRIWLPDQDIPGLSMTRAIGDSTCSSIGVISKPEIITRKIVANDKFIILASDGIWEFITTSEAVNIVA